MDTPAPKVTAIITFHREGLLAHKSLLSLGRCVTSAAKNGISVEIISTLDRSDKETIRVVQSFQGPGQPDRILNIDVGDLGSARNEAVSKSRGKYILICDGDDYLSADFIVRCLDKVLATTASAIIHPQLILTFENDHAMWRQIGSDEPDFDPECMLVLNPWNSCCFAEKKIFLDNPYVCTRPGETGFGFEDWHWNCETFSRGHQHLIAPQTVHYVRKKASGSLNNAHASYGSIIPPSSFFDLPC